MKHIVITLTALALVFAFSSCANTIRGVGRDIRGDTHWVTHKL